MKTGVSTASLFMRENNEDALPLLEGLGVKCAEVFLTSFGEYDDGFARLLKSRVGGLEITSVHDLNTQFEPQLFSLHKRVKRDAFFWLEKVLSAGKILGAPCYTFHGTARVKRASRSGKSDDFARMGCAFQEIAKTCEKYGISLCLENVEWATYNRPTVFSAMREYVPSLLGVLDVKQARISGYDYREYLNEMAERIALVHISDVDENGKIVLPSKGVFDFNELILRLKDVGFDGPLLVEVYKESYSEIAELKAACEYIDEILYKNNCLR